MYSSELDHQFPKKPTLSISYRGNKLEFVLEEYSTAFDVKKKIVDSYESVQQQPNGLDVPIDRILPSDIKLLWKGKVISDDNTNLWNLLHSNNGMKASTTISNKPIVYKIVAMGISSTQVEQFDNERVSVLQRTQSLVRDDLTERGQQELNRRARLGKMMLSKASSRSSGTGSVYGFGKIEILPNLPNGDEARSILQTLANDPGVLACMAKHKWNVGTLAELYPDGKVGESPVCVMGLNKNKGQEILLRLRTDDLKGFRKILNIRKVLYHELAHNVYSEHDNNFFQLMRQVEQECIELDWTNGAGLSSGVGDGTNTHMYTAGTYRLGGGNNSNLDIYHQPINDSTPSSSIQAQYRRERIARAAEMRMTENESQEIEANCGCTPLAHTNNLFLPPTTVGGDTTGSITTEENKKLTHTQKQQNGTNG